MVRARGYPAAARIPHLTTPEAHHSVILLLHHLLIAAVLQGGAPISDGPWGVLEGDVPQPDSGGEQHRTCMGHGHNREGPVLSIACPIHAIACPICHRIPHMLSLQEASAHGARRDGELPRLRAPGLAHKLIGL